MPGHGARDVDNSARFPSKVLWLLGFVVGDLAAYAVDVVPFA
jgi:hypothetical protein